jgi:hypothetical protein
MENIGLQKTLKIPEVKNLTDILAILTEINQIEDVALSFPKLIIDFFEAKLFLLNVKNLQFRTKWNMSFEDFEYQSATWQNAASYELEQEYYQWSEVVSEIEHYQNIIKKWS